MTTRRGVEKADKKLYFSQSGGGVEWRKKICHWQENLSRCQPPTPTPTPVFTHIMHFLLLALILVTSVGAFGALTFILLARGIYKAPQRSNGTKSVMILMGSGGHTGEMARMLRDINLSPFDHRVWVYTDDFSAKKARNLDSELQNSQKARSNSPRFASLPRARRVGQSWITTVFSSFYCLIACFYMIVKEKPSLVWNSH